MENTEISLAIVTIYLLGSEDELWKTITSVEDQATNADEHILVVSGIKDENEFRRQFSGNGRRLILNRDKSLYNAMNIGLSEVTADYVFFLNGGDKFLRPDAMQCIKKNVSKNCCLLFRTAQYYHGDAYIRPRLTRLNTMRHFPAHQGFVAPSTLAKCLRFDEDPQSIGSDTVWMRELMSRSCANVISDILVEFSLGGVSNRPSFFACKARFHERGVAKFASELIKLNLSKLLGLSVYYRLIYLFKYEHVYRHNLNGRD